MIKVKDGYAKLISTSYTGNANYLLKSDGEAWEVHTGRNNEKNKIVRTDVSGYLQTGWINTTSGNTTATISRIYCSNDQYIRYQTPAQFFSVLANDTDNNKIYLTIAGQKRELAVNADTLDGLHADSFASSTHTHYIGTTQVQNSSAAQAVTGITTLTASGTIKSTYAGPAFHANPTSGWAYIRLQSGTGTFWDIATHSNRSYALEFRCNGNNPTTNSGMLLTTDGKLGIGTSSPTYNLHVVGTAYASTNVTSPYFKSTVATGTAPLTVASTTLVSNLNADMLDNKHLTDIAANGYIMDGYTIDASSLDADTFYPVIMRIHAHKTVRIEIRVGLNSGKPSWATHSSGFSVMKIWEVNGGDWGVAPEHRRILVSTYSYADIDPVRGIQFWDHSYYEVVYVRGGGKYYFYLSHNVSPSLKSEAYSITNSTNETLTISPLPLASAPAAIVAPSLTFNAGTFATKTFSNTSGTVTVNIPTKTSHLTNDSGYLANSVPWSKITGAPTTLKNPKALTLFGVSYDGSEAKTVDKTTFIGTLSEGTSNFTDDVMLVTSIAGNTNNNGFDTEGYVNIPYKRKAIYLWNYIKTKTDPLYVTKLGTNGNYLTYTINGTASNITVPYATTSGNAATATKLKTARKINGTDFDGSAAITTALWGTTRNITIGNTKKSVDGSADISWSLSEIGAASSGHNHDGRYVQRLYLDTGGNLTGYTGSYVIGVANLSDSSVYTNSGGCGLDNRSVILHLQGTNGTSSHWNQLYLNSGNVSFRTENATNWRRLAFVDELPTALKSPKSLTIKTNGTSLGSYDGSADKIWDITYSNVGAASSGHNHDGTYLKLTGGTMTGVITSTYTSNTWVNSLTSSAITLNNSGYGGWICGPTRNGRIAISTYATGGDYLYFGYGEKGRTTNSFATKMTWYGPENILTIDDLNFGKVNEIYTSQWPLCLNYTGRGDQNVLICSGNGNVGIGNTAPAYKLHVTGTLGVTGTSTFSGTMTIATDTFGALIVKRNDVSNGASIQFRGSSDVYGYIGSNKQNTQLLRWTADTNTTYTILDSSSTSLSDSTIKINGSSITVAKSDHTHTSLAAVGDQTISAKSYNTGFTPKPYYNSGGPTTYGNILEYVSNRGGGGQLAMEWRGAQTKDDGTDYNTGRLLYRSKRDCLGGWTTWQTVAWYADVSSNKIMQSGTNNAYDNTAGQRVICVSGKTLATSSTEWGSILQWCSNYSETPATTASDNWYNQLYGNTTGNLYFRTRTNGGNWAAWKQVAFASNFLPLSGGTMTGSINLFGDTSPDMTYSGNVHPKLIFSNIEGAQNVALIYTDYDSYRAPSGLKLVGSQGSEWFEVVGNIYGNAFVKSGGTAAQLLRADGGVAAFNWSGQSGQPTWLWGGNSQHAYYVYNPSNFSVANADTVDGYHATINNSASTVVARDANRYIYVTYINSAIGTEDTSTPTVFYYSYDNWIRKMSYSRLQTLLNGALKFVKKSDFHIIWAGTITRPTYNSVAWSATKLGGEATVTLAIYSTGRMTVTVSNGTPYTAFCSTAVLFNGTSTTYSAVSSTVLEGRSSGMGDYMVVVNSPYVYIRKFRQGNNDNDTWYTDELYRTATESGNKAVKQFYLMIIGTSS